MNQASSINHLRIGDCINFPSPGEKVGVHYTLRDQEDRLIESTHQWGSIFSWRVGSASVLPAIDEAIKSMSLGGKVKVVTQVVDKNMKEGSNTLIYEMELLYIT